VSGWQERGDRRGAWSWATTRPPPRGLRTVFPAHFVFGGASGRAGPGGDIQGRAGALALTSASQGRVAQLVRARP